MRGRHRNNLNDNPYVEKAQVERMKEVLVRGGWGIYMREWEREP